jgi:hypothetical protein
MDRASNAGADLHALQHDGEQAVWQQLPFTLLPSDT